MEKYLNATNGFSTLTDTGVNSTDFTIETDIDADVTNSSISTSLIYVTSTEYFEQESSSAYFLHNETSAQTPAGEIDNASTNTFDGYDYNDNIDYGDEYMYPGYSFERPVYLYIWEILVIVTSVVNIVVVCVLLRRKMRSSTNMILAVIAISDSLTGLVTLPTYIMAFQNFDPALKNSNFPPPTFPGFPHYNFSSASNNVPLGNMQPEHQGHERISWSLGFDEQLHNMTSPLIVSTHEPVDGYILSRALCRGFMISKYFLSKMFHTISIFLTLFLAIQRFISVAFPFKSQNFFSVRNTLICCMIIFLISPAFHAFHLGDEKAKDGMCQWELAESGCKRGCIYLWMMFFLRHFIPCMTLIIFTTLFIIELKKGHKNLRRMDSSSSQLSRRADENKRITVVVIAIVIVFLIPEVPYGVFLLYNAIEKTAHNGKGIDLETNRAIHMIYELLLVVSFHANFYIYTFLNRRFRKTLIRTFIHPVRRFFGDQRRFSLSVSSSATRPVTRRTDFSLSKSGHEMQVLKVNDSPKSSNFVLDISHENSKSDLKYNADKNIMETFSAEYTQN